MTNQAKAYTFAAITVLAWSTVPSAFKLSLGYLDPVQLLLYSAAVSVLVLGTILLAQGKARLVVSFTRRQYLRSLGLGLLNPLLYYLVVLKAYDLLPAQVAQPLNYTWALTLAYLSIPLLKQRIGLPEILAGLVCYSGVVVISTRGSVSAAEAFDPLGIALALGSTIIWALYWIVNTRDDRDPVAGLFLQFAFSLPFVTAACLLLSDVRVASPYGLLGAAYVGTFEMGVTFVCWLTALKLSENTARVGNLIFVAPFLSLVFIQFLVPDEEILASTVFGLLLIVAGLLIQRFGAAGLRVRRTAPVEDVPEQP